MRTDIAEYFAVNEKMPDSLSDLGHGHDGPPGNAPESIDVQAGGIIVLRFAPRPLGEVVLTPDSAADAIRGWQCESGGFTGIGQVTDCHFIGSIP